jgi:hypothetical protein
MSQQKVAMRIGVKVSSTYEDRCIKYIKIVTKRKSWSCITTLNKRENQNENVLLRKSMLKEEMIFIKKVGNFTKL